MLPLAYFFFFLIYVLLQEVKAQPEGQSQEKHGSPWPQGCPGAPGVAMTMHQPTTTAKRLQRISKLFPLSRTAF